MSNVPGLGLNTAMIGFIVMQPTTMHPKIAWLPAESDHPPIATKIVIKAAIVHKMALTIIPRWSTNQA